jgi:heme a synthase
MERLEHGHRYTAEAVGLLVAILCAWVWGSRWAIPIASAGAVAGAIGAHVGGLAKGEVVLSGLGAAAAAFVLMIVAQVARPDHVHPPGVRWLAFTAFLGVLAQAVLGGLRVIHDPAGTLAGDAASATTLRIVHGAFAQFELCLLVAVAAMLSRIWWERPNPPGQRLGPVRWLAWITVVFVFLQLIVGATLRHQGAGMVIPTFPESEPGNYGLPLTDNILTQLHYVHSRIGAAIVSLLVLVTALRAIGNAGGDVRIIRPAVMLLACTVVQVVLGMHIIWWVRPPILTTMHVLNGALLLATVLLLAMRASRRPVADPHHISTDSDYSVALA